MFRILVVNFAMMAFVIAGPADIIKKCASSDTKCMKESTAVVIPGFVKGIPEFGIEPMEPLLLKEVDASSPSLKFLVRDFNVKGLSSCKPKKIQRDVAKSQLYVRLICDVQADGLYELKGNLLVLPIEGNDKVHLKIDKIAINVDIDMDIKTGDDGKKYWTIKEWRHSYELNEKADLVFDKLFEKNEVLRTAANDLVSNNSNEIINEIGGPIIKAIIGRIVKNVRALFDNVPYDNLSVD